MAGNTTQMEPKYKHAPLENRMEEARDELEALESEAMRKESPLVTIRDKIYIVLLRYGLANILWVSCLVTGFHPWNRSTSGIIPSKVENKVCKFGTHGFSFAECLRACSVKRNPKSGQAHEAINIEVTSASSQLANVTPGSLQQFSLTCNHTNQAIRAIDAGVPLCDKKIAPEGTVNKALMCQKDPDGIGQAVHKGMPWLQIEGIVEEQMPNIIKIVIEADNIPNELADVDATQSLLLKCHAMLMEATARSPPDTAEKDIIDLALTLAMRTEITRSKEDLLIFIQYAQKWGGGDEPTLLRDIDGHAKRIQALRDLPAALLQPLKDLSLGAATGALWRTAVIKLHLNGAEKPFSTTDIRSMASDTKKPFVLKAEEHMHTARAMKAQCGDASDIQEKFMNFLEMFDFRMVKHVTNRSRDFKTTTEIINMFIQDCRSEGLSNVPVKWGSIATPKAKAKASTKPSPNPANAQCESVMINMVSGVADSDTILQILEKKGCKPGNECKSVANDLKYKIMSMDTKTTKLTGMEIPHLAKYGAQFEVSVPTDELQKRFKLFKEGKKEERSCVSTASDAQRPCTQKRIHKIVHMTYCIAERSAEYVRTKTFAKNSPYDFKSPCNQFATRCSPTNVFHSPVR